MLLAAMLAVWGLASPTVQANRNDAFIGYTERITGCTDQLDDCRQKSHHDGCLLEPYTMRESCPISCAVDRCLLSGTVRVRRRHVARRSRVAQAKSGLQNLLNALVDLHPGAA